MLRVLFTANPADEANADAFLFGYHSTGWAGSTSRSDRRMVYFRSGNGLRLGDRIR